MRISDWSSDVCSSDLPNDPLNHAALGYDMYSEPIRRAAMRRAWQTGRPAASGIVELVQESKARGKQAGFLIYVPVYAESARPAMVALANHARTDDNRKNVGGGKRGVGRVDTGWCSIR